MLDFPDAPIEGQVFAPTGVRPFIYKNARWARVVGDIKSNNLIVNPSMQHNQQNADVAGTTANYYAADQWYTYFALVTGAQSSQRVNSQTPSSAQNRYRLTVTTANTSLGSTDVVYIAQRIEANYVTNTRFGKADARQLILRFGFKAPAGTYSAALLNAFANRSFVAEFTITAGQANTDTIQTVVIPGDTTGTWAITGTAHGMTLSFNIAQGSSGVGVAGWQAGSYRTTANCSNGMDTVGNVFDVFDVGLYIDYYNTGVAPTYDLPDYAWELRRCQRYYLKMPHPGLALNFVSYAANAVYSRAIRWPVPMRIVPSLTNGLTGNGETLTSCGAITIDVPSTTGCRMYLAGSSTTANANVIFVAANHISANARM